MNMETAELSNTLLKMAKKRALVDATLSATRSSDLFTQDIEDMASLNQAAEQEEEQTSQQSTPAVKPEFMELPQDTRKRNRFKSGHTRQCGSAPTIRTRRPHHDKQIKFVNELFAKKGTTTMPSRAILRELLGNAVEKLTKETPLYW